MTPADHEPTPVRDADGLSQGQQALSEALQSSFRLLRFLMVLLVAAYFASGIFTVKQHEKAFVLVLGKIRSTGDARIKDAGLHWTWPRPFSEIIRVPAERVQAVSTDRFWTGGEQGPAVMQSGPLTPGRDGYLLTGDANIIHSQWTVRYVIDRPEVYYFKLQGPEGLIRKALEQAVLSAVASTGVDAALRSGQQDLRDAVGRLVREALGRMDAGVTVQGVEFVIAPPGQVQMAFNEVSAMEQIRTTIISAARAGATKRVLDAEAESSQRKAEAAAQALASRRAVEADVVYLKQVKAQLGGHPEVLLESLRQAAWQRAMTDVKERYVVEASKDGEIRLKLSPQKKKKKAAPVEPLEGGR